MSRKRDMGHDGIQEEILRKLEDSSIQRQIDIGGGVVVNITQEDYGKGRKWILGGVTEILGTVAVLQTSADLWTFLIFVNNSSIKSWD